MDSFFSTKTAMPKPMATNPLMAKPLTGMSLDMIYTKLYQIPDHLHFCHHNTTSFAQHKALDYAYEETSSLQDELVEKLIGYTGQRIGTLSLSPISGYSNDMPKQCAKDIMEFGKALEEWAEQNEYCDIENIAQGYSGVGAKLNYLLTLS